MEVMGFMYEVVLCGSYTELGNSGGKYPKTEEFLSGEAKGAWCVVPGSPAASPNRVNCL